MSVHSIHGWPSWHLHHRPAGIYIIARHLHHRSASTKSSGINVARHMAPHLQRPSCSNRASDPASTAPAHLQRPHIYNARTNLHRSPTVIAAHRRRPPMFIAHPSSSSSSGHLYRPPIYIVHPATLPTAINIVRHLITPSMYCQEPLLINYYDTVCILNPFSLQPTPAPRLLRPHLDCYTYFQMLMRSRRVKIK